VLGAIRLGARQKRRDPLLGPGLAVAWLSLAATASRCLTKSSTPSKASRTSHPSNQASHPLQTTAFSLPARMNHFPEAWGRVSAILHQSSNLKLMASQPRDDVYGPYNHGYLQTSHPNQHTQSPIVTGTSVVAMKFKDGVVIAADNLGNVSWPSFQENDMLNESLLQHPTARLLVSPTSSAYASSMTKASSALAETYPTCSTSIVF
jgi:hypothetical protein